MSWRQRFREKRTVRGKETKMLMTPELARVLQAEREREFRHRERLRAAAARASRPRRPVRGRVVIRLAGDADDEALARLAILSERPPLEETVLVAEADGVLLAARSLESGRVLADPFRVTSDLRDLLSVRAAQLETPAPKTGGVRGRLAALAAGLRWLTAGA
jgi:hypothetical protein